MFDNIKAKAIKISSFLSIFLTVDYTLASLNHDRKNDRLLLLKKLMQQTYPIRLLHILKIPVQQPVHLNSIIFGRIILNVRHHMVGVSSFTIVIVPGVHSKIISVFIERSISFKGSRMVHLIPFVKIRVEHSNFIAKQISIDSLSL